MVYIHRSSSFFVGLCSGILTTTSFFPQVLKVVRTGSVNGLSFPMFFTHFIGDLVWITYGIMVSDVIIITFEIIASMCNLIILVYFILDMKNRRLLLTTTI